MITAPREALHEARGAAADAALAAFDFNRVDRKAGDIAPPGPLLIESCGAWEHARRPEPAGVRWLCLVEALVTNGATDTPPTMMRAQFNVFFAPDTATITDVYEGEWR